MKPIRYIYFTLCLPVFFSCTSKAPTDHRLGGDTIPVTVMILKKENKATAVAVSGQFTTDDEVMLSFKAAGIINNVLVKEGDAVKKGQLLAALNPTEINAQVQQSGLVVEKAMRDYQRTQNLYRDSVATLEQLQNSKTTLQQAREQLTLVSFNRRYMEIHAPADGYILKKMANSGQQVQAGAPVLQSNGGASGRWLLRVNLSDQEWAAIRVRDAAMVQTGTHSGNWLKGIVNRKSAAVDPATGTFSADIALTEPHPQAIAAGMFGKAVITPSKQHVMAGSWQIPYEALLDGDGSNGYVYVTNDFKKAHKVKVGIGAIDKSTVTITAGLADARALIISGSAYLADNSSIVIYSPSAKTK